MEIQHLVKAKYCLMCHIPPFGAKSQMHLAFCLSPKIQLKICQGMVFAVVGYNLLNTGYFNTTIYIYSYIGFTFTSDSVKPLGIPRCI